MADNYLRFSTVIALRDEEELTWAQQVIAFLNRWEEDEAKPGDDPYNVVDNLADPDYLGFQVEITDGGLWIYADERGTPENVVSLVQAYLRCFDPKGCFAFEWAVTCSKMCVDEFSGGGVFITATTDEWITAGQWTAQKIAAHHAARNSTPEPKQNTGSVASADTEEMSLGELIDLAGRTIAGYHPWSNWLEHYHDPAKSTLVDLLAEFGAVTNIGPTARGEADND